MTTDLSKNEDERSEAPPANDRRAFLKSTAALGSLPLFADSLFPQVQAVGAEIIPEMKKKKSIIGGYGSWAAGLAEDPALLSFRRDEWKGREDVDSWRQKAQAKAKELFASPDSGGVPEVTVNKKYKFDGLDIEELSWQLPFGHATQAIFLKPAGAVGPLPAVLGLHDHGGDKYHGKRKITQTSDSMPSFLVEHQKISYESHAWANDLAKRGYAVLVHDVFPFASRRVLFAETSEIPWGHCRTEGLSDENPEDEKNIRSYNAWASDHEAIMAKALFSAGTTWPGVFLTEDQRALDVLDARDDVDSDRLGCAGLSGGGLRTVYLGGMDSRVKCAVAVGFMSTWNDFLLNKCFTHTWMTYAPLLPKYLAFPEILGMRVPLPTMTLNNINDTLFTLPEMKKANAILEEVFAKADASDNYRGGFYPGLHKFDVQMQQDAFDWFDQWLKR